jgi:outer membrane protein TolC
LVGDGSWVKSSRLAYSSEILPKAKENLALVTQGFSSGEIDFLQSLTAQRTYAQTKFDYLNSLRRLWQEHVNIRGLLLSGSLK